MPPPPQLPGSGPHPQPPTREPSPPIHGLFGSLANLPTQPTQPQPAPATPWLLRQPRNRFFTARRQVLTSLRQALRQHGAAALTGLPGLGKSNTAAEYAYQHRPTYTAVFWVLAETRESLLAGFSAIAALLDLPAALAREQELVVAAVLHWLDTNPGWLLIFDNANHLPLLREFLPPQQSGHILLTTNLHAVSAIAEPIPVDQMSPEEGALLLLRRAGAIKRDAELTTATEPDRNAALALSHELGGLPLALDQAGAYCEEMQLTLARYSRLYSTERATLLAARGTLGDHPSVTVTFTIAFQQVTARNPAAADLLRICAFLAPDAIPEEIFTSGEASSLGEPLATAAHNDLAFTTLLADASHLSLLHRDPTNNTLTIHRLVQAVIQSTMPDAERRTWAKHTVRSLDDALPAVEFANWSFYQKLTVHAQACADLIQQWTFEFPQAARLLNQLGFYLAERALFAESVHLCQRALDIYEKTLEPDHPDIAASLNNLAGVYGSLGDYGKAESLYQRALNIREKALGPDHPETAASLNNLALIYDSLNDYSKAKQLYQRAFDIREKALGPDHPETAASLNNLAGIYRVQGDYSRAEQLYQRALNIFETALGQDHPYTATSLNNLAGVYCYLRDYSKAGQLYQRALSLVERALGPDHPDTATSLNNLAGFHLRQKDSEKAEPLYLRSLEILGRSLGPSHPDFITCLHNLAQFYRIQGNDAEAERLLSRLPDPAR